MSLKLDTSIRYIKGVGPAKAKLFNKLGVFTVEDLLNYFPRDYMFPVDDLEQRLAEMKAWKILRKKT